MLKSNLRAQNIVILLASYVFYGWWDYRFLSLIFFSTILDYFLAARISKVSNLRLRELFLGLSLSVNLGFLGFFKYWNFFVSSFRDAFSFFGQEFSGYSIDVILPVGISFYTFQTLSYTIDVYKGKLEPARNFISFASYVSFFPQLVAGPIERATHLLPQFYHSKKFEFRSAMDGMTQILWGLFKKIVVADNAAQYANMVFNDYESYSSLSLVLGAVMFAFQIYGDFSGYSDIAIGTAKLFGYDLMKNFSTPYFSRDIAEFWRRWHISLSTWFRDYLYIPLGGSRGSSWMKIRNVFIIFLVSGFWHGANWTFIVWGGIKALFFLPLLLAKRNRSNISEVAEGNLFPNLRDFLAILGTFMVTTLAWVFFRSASISDALLYIERILSFKHFDDGLRIGDFGVIKVLALIMVLLFVEWLGRHKDAPFHIVNEINSKFVRVLVYYTILGIIILVGSFGDNQFIYFQF